MKGLLERLKHKYGPLPLWAWTSIAGGAGWFYMRSRGGGAVANAGTPDATLPEPVTVPTQDSTGDLSGGAGTGAGAGGGGGQLQGTPEQFADAGVTSDFQDFMSQLEQRALSDNASNGPPNDTTVDTTNKTTDTTTKVEQPKTTAKASKRPPRGKPRWVPGRGKEKSHWAYPNGTWASAPKGAKPPAPKTAKPKATKPAKANRSRPLIGKGAAGARPRSAPKPPAPKARPRVQAPAAPARGIAKKTTTAPKAKPAPPRKPFALPGMRPIGRR